MTWEGEGRITTSQCQRFSTDVDVVYAFPTAGKTTAVKAGRQLYTSLHEVGVLPAQTSLPNPFIDMDMKGLVGGNLLSLGQKSALAEFVNASVSHGQVVMTFPSYVLADGLDRQLRILMVLPRTKDSVLQSLESREGKDLFYHEVDLNFAGWKYDWICTAATYVAAGYKIRLVISDRKLTDLISDWSTLVWKHQEVSQLLSAYEQEPLSDFSLSEEEMFMELVCQ